MLVLRVCYYKLSCLLTSTQCWLFIILYAPTFYLRLLCTPEWIFRFKSKFVFIKKNCTKQILGRHVIYTSSSSSFFLSCSHCLCNPSSRFSVWELHFWFSVWRFLRYCLSTLCSLSSMEAEGENKSKNLLPGVSGVSTSLNNFPCACLLICKKLVQHDDFVS